MNAGSERLVINSSSDFQEIDRAQWEEIRSRYIFDRAGAEAAIDSCVDSRREGASDAEWKIVSTSRVAGARVGRDFLPLLREVARQPTALRTAIAELSNASGWSRRAAGGDHRELCCAFSDGQFKIALAPDQSTSLDTLDPDSILFLRGPAALSLVEKWLPDLINHLRLRDPG